MAHHALAASFTVVNSQTVNATQVLDTAGDVGTVEQGGTINVMVGSGIEGAADGVTVNNAGSVTGGTFCIVVFDNNTITNAGAASGGDTGIVASSGNTITNAGTATGGVEHAKADYGGFLISPSLRVGTNIAAGSGTFTPSLRLRYAGLFLESYEETGSAADLNVDSRDISIFDARAELAYTLAATGMSGGSLYQTVRVGVDGTISDGGDVDSTLVGQALNFDVSGDSLVRGYVGYDAVFAITDDASLNLSAEAGYDATEAVTLQVQGGMTFTF